MPTSERRRYATHRWGTPFFYSARDTSVCERCGMVRTFVMWKGCCAVLRYTHGASSWVGTGPGMCNAFVPVRRGTFQANP